MATKLVAFRISEQDLPKLVNSAFYRFVRKRSTGMKEDSVSEYMRYLVNKDMDEIRREVESRAQEEV